MVSALFIVAFLFIVQTWLASLLAGGRESFSDDEAGNAFFKLVEAASSTGWMNAFFVVNVLAVGFANAMAAQAATSRLLYSMSRDRQLPSFLSKISARQVPMAAILLVSAISVVLVLFFVGQIALISSLVNFGALFGFCLLHISVVWYYVGRKKSKNYLLHLVVPTLGFLIIAYVLFNADSLAKIGGIVWLAHRRGGVHRQQAPWAGCPAIFRRARRARRRRQRRACDSCAVRSPVVPDRDLAQAQPGRHRLQLGGQRCGDAAGVLAGFGERADHVQRIAGAFGFQVDPADQLPVEQERPYVVTELALRLRACRSRCGSGSPNSRSTRGRKKISGSNGHSSAVPRSRRGTIWPARR